MAEPNEDRHGRWAVTLVLAVVMTYGAVMIFGSLIYDLYGKQPDIGATADGEPTWCIGQLAMLHAELENQAQQELQALNPGEKRAERWRRWQGNWSERFSIASKLCHTDPTFIDAYATLNELSTDYAGILQELGGTRLHLRAHLNEVVRHLTK